jgi:hypothetical protein
LKETELWQHKTRIRHLDRIGIKEARIIIGDGRKETTGRD